VNNPLYATIAGPCAHLIDLLNMVRFRFLNPHSYTKYRQIVAVARRTRARSLIETGTFRGVTARRCVPHFSRVYTIELDEELSRDAQVRLSRFRNCEVIQGDATLEIQKLLQRPDIGGDLLFFLDGHFSGEGTALGASAEPALDVIRVIARHKDRVAGILVDDFREFGSQPGWPTKQELIGTLEQEFSDSSFSLLVNCDQAVVMRRA
jgi:hypothetical protein